MKAAREFIPIASFTKPMGRYCMWVELRQQRFMESEIINKIESHGVRVSPGSSFFPYSTDKIGFRISIAHRDEKEIKEGIRRIGQALAI